MSTATYHRRSANEKNIDELQSDTIQWDSLFQNNTEEIQFLKQILLADVFDNSIPNLYERLQEFYTEIADLKTEKIDLHEELHNHRNDLNGMMECEDISCEAFYHDQHQRLADKIENHLQSFQQMKRRLYRFCIPLLKKQAENS